MTPDLVVPPWLQDALIAAETDPAVRIPLQSVLRSAFRAGHRAVPLVQDWLRVERWPANPVVGGAYGSTRGGASIIIPVRGAHEALRLCLECLRAHTPSSMNNSLTLTVAEEESAAVRTVHGLTGPWCPDMLWDVATSPEPQSFARNCNLGARKSNGKFLVFLNSDAFVGPGWLEALLAPFADPDVVAVGPMGTNVSGHQQAAISAAVGGRGPTTMESIRGYHAAWKHEREQLNPSAPYAARRLVGFCLAVRRSAFDAIGGFDESFENAFDDDDLCLRLTLLAGAKACVVVPDLLVLHAGHASFAELPDAERTFNEALAKNGEHFKSRWSWISGDWGSWLDKENVR